MYVNTKLEVIYGTLEAKLFRDATFIFIRNHGKELPKELNYWGVQTSVYINELKAHSQEILDKHKRSFFLQRTSFLQSLNSSTRKVIFQMYKLDMLEDILKKLQMILH